MAVPRLRGKALSREVHFPRRGYRVRAEVRRVLVVRRLGLCGPPGPPISMQKEEIQMASIRTYKWGVLLGLAALPRLAFANQEVIKLTQDSKNWAMQAGYITTQAYSTAKHDKKTNATTRRRPGRH